MGWGVNGFILDFIIGEFCLSYIDIQILDCGNYYFVNQGYYFKFDVEMCWYIDYCFDLNLWLCYIGFMVFDIYCIFFQGGIFFYFNICKYLQGKFRLVYECNLLVYIVEQAGGKVIICQLECIFEFEVNYFY